MRIVGNAPSGGKKPTTPTIGTATDDGTGTGVSVAFTPSTYIGKGTITYTATSSPGSLTNTGSGSPIVVSGLTTGTAYTFTVQGATNYGVNSDASAASNSVTPAAPSSFESIATATASGTSSVTFSSISGSYKALQLRVMQSQGANNATQIRLYFNNDTAANYRSHLLQGNGSTASGNAGGTDGIQVMVGGGSISSSTSVKAVSIIDIIDYASTSKNKTVKSFSGVDANVASTNSVVVLNSGAWFSTSAITSIKIDISFNGQTFDSGSTFALYGIKG